MCFREAVKNNGLNKRHYKSDPQRLLDLHIEPIF
jgi:hypothetical protein